MDTVVPIDFGAKMIISVNHFMNCGIDGVLLGTDMIGAKQNLMKGNHSHQNIHQTYCRMSIGICVGVFKCRNAKTHIHTAIRFDIRAAHYGAIAGNALDEISVDWIAGGLHGLHHELDGWVCKTRSVAKLKENSKIQRRTERFRTGEYSATKFLTLVQFFDTRLLIRIRLARHDFVSWPCDDFVLRLRARALERNRFKAF